jgi:hypothetical protein
MKKIWLLTFWLSLVGCTSDTTAPKTLASKEMIIDKISNLSSLGTVEYTLSKIISVDHKIWYAWGARKILMSANCYVKAGIDFKGIKITNIDDSTKTISVLVPHPEILTINIPPNEIVLLYEKIGYFRRKFSSEELNDFQAQAETDIKLKVYQLPILDEAKKNGKIFLRKFLRNFGFTTINITYE